MTFSQSRGPSCPWRDALRRNFFDRLFNEILSVQKWEAADSNGDTAWEKDARHAPLLRHIAPVRRRSTQRWGFNNFACPSNDVDRIFSSMMPVDRKGSIPRTCRCRGEDVYCMTIRCRIMPSGVARQVLTVSINRGNIASLQSTWIGSARR